jgi:hypothetical protein
MATDRIKYPKTQDVFRIISHGEDATDAVISEMAAEGLGDGSSAIKVVPTGGGADAQTEALELVLNELRVMNMHLAAITGLQIECEDID